MGEKDSFEKALQFTKLTVCLVCTWPPSRNATKWEIIKADVIWLLSLLSGLCACFPLIYSIYVNKSNTLVVTQTAVFVSSIFNFLIKSFVYRVHRKRTQILLYEMEDFLKNVEPHERIILQRYLDRCWPFHKFITFVNFSSTFLMILSPLILSDQSLPTDAVYPFNVESGFPKYLVYLHQSIAGLQCSAGGIIDCQGALIMWLTAARLEILADEILDVTDDKEFRFFIRKHEKLIFYATEASNTMSYVAFTSSTTCGILAIMSALQLFSNQPLIVKVKFGVATALGGLNLLISACPADNLIHVCDLLGKAVYNMQWVDASPSMVKNCITVLRRCQRPIIVSIGGFLPTLSLSSYISFASGLFSYFTTIRLVMTPDAET